MNLPGLAELRGGEVELAGLRSAAPQVDARGEFSANLAELKKRFALQQELSGKASGEYAVTLSGSEIKAASASVDLPDLLMRNGALVVSGPARGHAVLGESYSFDLSDARIEQTGVFAKPKRTTLSVTGKLGREPSLAALKDGLVKIGANELPLTFALGQKPMKLHLGKTTLDLANLRELLPPDKPALSGKLAVDGFDVTARSAAGHRERHAPGRGDHARARPRQHLGPAAREGRDGRGRERDRPGRRPEDRPHGELRAAHRRGRPPTSTPSRVSSRRWSNALSGRKELAGVLTTSGQVTAKAAGVATLNGSGKLEIRPGQIKGFSLTKQVFGSLAAVPTLALAAKGKDMSKYEQEEFSYLTATTRSPTGA